jgi:hypothetical protein
MKIRKTLVNERQENIFIYENKKDEYFVVAVPVIEWSAYFTYDEIEQVLIPRWTESLICKLGEQMAEELALKIYRWTREM